LAGEEGIKPDKERVGASLKKQEKGKAFGRRGEEKDSVTKHRQSQKSSKAGCTQKKGGPASVK